MDAMYVDENSESPFQPLTKHPLLTISEDTKEAEKNEFGETGETVVECSAAGIPLKKIRVIQEERSKVAVCGAPVGIYMETDGVMVIRTAEIRSSDGTVSPSVDQARGRRLYHKSKRTEHPQQAGAD